jgi:hypothetical protein
MSSMNKTLNSFCKTLEDVAIKDWLSTNFSIETHNKTGFEILKQIYLLWNNLLDVKKIQIAHVMTDHRPDLFVDFIEKFDHFRQTPPGIPKTILHQARYRKIITFERYSKETSLTEAMTEADNVYYTTIKELGHDPTDVPTERHGNIEF